MATVTERQGRLAGAAREDVRGGSPGTRQMGPRQAAGAAARTPGAVVSLGGRLGRAYSGRGMLTAELLVGVVIVAIRAVEDYEPQQDGTLKGKIGHPAGQYGPLPILAGLLAWFFLLSFLAARGGTKAKVAVIAGGLTDLVLAMKSTSHFTKVATTFSGFGKAKVPPGSWQTTGSIAGQADSGSASSGGSSSPGSPSSGSDPHPWDGTTGNSSDPNSMDPLTGTTYGDDTILSM